jgi:PhoH-like ATPase
VLDTNVLLHNPGAIYMFHEHEVVLPLVVIEELDRFKSNNDDKGRNARQVIREIDKLRVKEGHLFEGVAVNDHGGSLRIDRCDGPMPFQLDPAIVDNRILGVAASMHAQGKKTIFISKDINARVKADALGIEVEDFEADRVDADWLYSGQADITVPGELIDTLYNERQLPLEQIKEYRLRFSRTNTCCCATPAMIRTPAWHGCWPTPSI